METLFHYTDAAGVLGIVRDSVIWASDVRFLNDAQEGVYGREGLVAAVEAMANPLANPAHRLHGTAAEADFAKLWEEFRLSVLERIGSRAVGVYVSCFCESGDLLSQWREYGRDHGYALEFRVSALRECLDGHLPGADLAAVRYGAGAAREVIDEALARLSEFGGNHPGMDAHYGAMALTAMLARIKHPAFEEEREWRLILADEALDDSGRTDGGEARFRAGAMAVVPYLAVPLPAESLVSIRVGPGNNLDVREAGVRRLLVSLGRSINILRSEVPLRV